MRAARKLFPFITIGNMKYTITPHTTASDMYSYNIDILAGTASLVPGVAFDGAESGKKGIVQMCDDIAAALRASTLGGFLIFPISVTVMHHGKGKKTGSAIWLGNITIKCEKLIRR